MLSSPGRFIKTKTIMRTKYKKENQFAVFVFGQGKFKSLDNKKIRLLRGIGVTKRERISIPSILSSNCKIEEKDLKALNNGGEKGEQYDTVYGIPSRDSRVKL